MNADDQELLDLAGRVSDGREIDWETEESSASDAENRRLIRHLRVVHSLAEVHRSREGEPAGASDPSQMAATTRPSDLTADDSGSHASAGETAPERWGRLEIREKLGEGAFGAVYRAWDPNLQLEVALKLLKSRTADGSIDADEFLREGRLLARLQHPNVITVHSAEVHDGRVGIWMELVRGRTLGAQIREQGRFGAREATLIGLELCRALAAVHGAGLIHRDVKSQNVMRGEGGRILLMDFGAGRDLEVLADEPERGVSGTPLYMAPETVLRGSTSRQSDIYSLGVLLYYLVTGEYPVRAGSLVELAELHRRHESRLLRDARADLPDSFVRVVEKALAPDPEQRFASAGEMEQALNSALGMEPNPVRPEREAASRSKRFTSWLVAAAVMLIAVAIAFVGWRSQPEDLSDVVAVSAQYEVQAALYRLPPSGSERDRLVAGDRLAIGDRLSLELRSSVPLHVYIFNEDEQGHSWALFPLPGFELQNPLPPGVTHRLPGRIEGGEEQLWRVDTPGGTEHLVVLASPDRLVEYEAELAKLPRPQGSLAVAVPPEAAMRLRGIGGLAASPGTPEASADASADQLFELAHRLAGGTEQVEGVWLRQIELLNPLP